MKTIESLPEKRARKWGKARSTITLAVVLGIVAVMTIAMNVAPNIPNTGRNQPVVYGDALEKDYAAPWIAEQNKPVYNHALEMQYAKPWLQHSSQYGDAMEMQYAAPWLNVAGEIDCNSRLDLLYACRYGLGNR